MKIITNNKDFFDQSLDEIKLLTLLKNNHNNLDDVHLLKIFGLLLLNLLSIYFPYYYYYYYYYYYLLLFIIIIIIIIHYLTILMS